MSPDAELHRRRIYIKFIGSVVRIPSHRGYPKSLCGTYNATEEVMVWELIKVATKKPFSEAYLFRKTLVFVFKVDESKDVVGSIFAYNHCICSTSAC
jgi:hypothetical protein